MSTQTLRNASIAVASALATIVMVAAIVLAGGTLGTPVPLDEPIVPAFETTSNDTPTQVDGAPTQQPVVQDQKSIATPSNCALYGGIDGLPILDTHRCLASDRVVTVE